MAFKPKSITDFLTDLINRQNEARDTIQAFLKFRDSQPQCWRGVLAVPPGSPIDTVLEAFNRFTDIPLELPFFTLMHFVSGWLLEKRVIIKGSIGEFYPELWTIVLADSGAGKTLAHDVIAKVAPVKSSFPEPASGARFIQALQQHNFSLWFQDEIAQKMKQIDTPQSPLSDIKEYLLRAYGNSKIERSTKMETITIEKPCLGILGLNTPESFFKSISQESLLDGFMQRFACVIAEPDPARNIYQNAEKYAIYDIETMSEIVAEAFAAIQTTPLHPEYIIDVEGEAAFKSAFATLISSEIPLSYFRRVMFRSFKYAVLYHVVLGKKGNFIDAEDIGWGARVSYMHLQDAVKLLNRDQFAEVKKLYGKAEKVKQRFQQLGKKFTSRDLQQNIWKMDGKTAKALHELVK